MSKFHQSPQWRKVSKEFKTPRCVDCGKTEDIEAGHILPASRFKMFRLWQSNLVEQCRSCNAKLGSDIRWSIQAIKLLGIYYMTKLLINGILMCLFAFALVVVFKDFQSGGMDASFSGQLLIDIWELIKELWQWLSQLLQSSLNPKPYQ